jgi:anthranilate synthase component 1
MTMVVLRHPLGRWVDPVAAFAALFQDSPRAFWLDAGAEPGAGARSYLGAGSRAIGSLDELRAELVAGSVSPRDDRDRAEFALGWVGWLGYELRGDTMGEPVDSATAPAALMFVDRALAFDHDTRTVELLTLGSDQPEWRADVEAALVGARVPAAAPPGASVSAVWAHSDDEYLAMIAACQRAIREGDAYQLCLTTAATVDSTPDAFLTYLAVRATSPARHGGFIVCDGVALLSASPEQFLSVTPGGVVESSPVKGTRARTGDDAAEIAELRSSDKERAENLMIVDLMRNDIGRISDVGTVSVSALLEVETLAHVHQLVSTVRGRLALGLDAVDVVRATFPAGSMTGAPKLAATRILNGLERRPRGIYAGAFGYFSLDGSVDLAMVIRSIVLTADGATIGAGGGITALSVPAEELAEVKLKAAALLRVLGVEP